MSWRETGEEQLLSLPVWPKGKLMTTGRAEAGNLIQLGLGAVVFRLQAGKQFRNWGPKQSAE